MRVGGGWVGGLVFFFLPWRMAVSDLSSDSHEGGVKGRAAAGLAAGLALGLGWGPALPWVLGGEPTLPRALKLPILCLFPFPLVQPHPGPPPFT